MKRISFCLILIFIAYNLSAQSDPNDGNFRLFSVKLHNGKHHYTGSILKDKLKNGYNAIEVRTGWQSKGKRAWERQLNFPAYGIGWYRGNVGDPDIFGTPNAVFGFIDFNITTKKRFSLLVEPALGLTYNLKPYNPNVNAINDAIGAKFAVYFALHGGVRYRIRRELDVLLGFDLTHFSNGRTVTPNMGLNMAGFSFGVCYHYNSKQAKVDNSLHPKTILEVRPTYGKREKAEKTREDNISLIQAVGTVQNIVDAGTNFRYLTSSTLLEYQHKFNSMHGVSVGFDALYDPSAKDTAEFKLNKEKRATFFPAAHLGYDFMFGRLSIKFQMGVNLSAIGRQLKGTTFIRPALRYEFNKRLFGQLGLKTFNGGTADWIEFGVGYKFVRSTHHKK